MYTDHLDLELLAAEADRRRQATQMAGAPLAERMLARDHAQILHNFAGHDIDFLKEGHYDTSLCRTQGQLVLIDGVTVSHGTTPIGRCAADRNWGLHYFKHGLRIWADRDFFPISWRVPTCRELEAALITLFATRSNPEEVLVVKVLTEDGGVDPMNPVRLRSKSALITARA